MEHESTVHSHGKSGKPQTGLHEDWGQKGGVISSLYSVLGSSVLVHSPKSPSPPRTRGCDKTTQGMWQGVAEVSGDG